MAFTSTKPLLEPIGTPAGDLNKLGDLVRHLTHPLTCLSPLLYPESPPSPCNAAHVPLPKPASLLTSGGVMDGMVPQPVIPHTSFFQRAVWAHLWVPSGLGWGPPPTPAALCWPGSARELLFLQC